jgi:DNA-binding NarL/FixJ family response regulator
MLPAFDNVAAFLAHYQGQHDSKNPEIVLLDNHLPGIPGNIALPRLISALPHTRFIMLTVDDSDSGFQTSVANGASGYLIKDAEPDSIIATIRATSQGKILFQGSAAKLFRDVSAARSKMAYFGLSPREIEVVSMLKMGLTHKEIADILCISKHTVDNHCRHIYKKLNVSSAVQAISKLNTRWS